MSSKNPLSLLKGGALDRTREEHYQAWKESGLTQQAYCKAQGLSVQALINGRKRLRKKECHAAVRAGAPRFIPVAVRQETAPLPREEDACLEVRVKGEVTIVVRLGFSAPLLRQVVTALR